MGGVEEGQGLACRNQVDLRRSSKEERTESMAMLPAHPKGPMMGASMGSMGARVGSMAACRVVLHAGDLTRP